METSKAPCGCDRISGDGYASVGHTDACRARRRADHDKAVAAEAKMHAEKMMASQMMANLTPAQIIKMLGGK